MRLQKVRAHVVWLLEVKQGYELSLTLFFVFFLFVHTRMRPYEIMAAYLLTIFPRLPSRPEGRAQWLQPVLCPGLSLHLTPYLASTGN